MWGGEKTVKKIFQHMVSRKLPMEKLLGNFFCQG